MEDKLRLHLIQLLQQGRELAAEWQCDGGDPMICIYLDEDPLESNNALATLLSEQIAFCLDLPDDDPLQGRGKIILEGKQVFLIHESQAQQNSQASIDKTETNSGKINLF